MLVFHMDIFHLGNFENIGKLYHLLKIFIYLLMVKTLKDGSYTSFTFGKEEFIEFRKVIRSGTGGSARVLIIKNMMYYHIEQRWSARFFGIDKVFAPFNFEECKSK